MKVLVVSHNCFNTVQNMGKTFSSLFSEFKQDELMQLYFYPTLPNIDQCVSLFRITDRDVVKSLYHRKGLCGRVITPNEIHPNNGLYEDEACSKTYNKKRKFELLSRRCRDFMWAIGSWKSDALKDWLQEEKPDVVFYALGNATFSQNIALWISKFLNIPLVTYVCDEFYDYYKNLKNPFSRLICKPLVRNIRKTILNSKQLVTICNELGIAYQKEFGSSYAPIITGSAFSCNCVNRNEDFKQISYIGNLGLNRWKSLIQIASAIKVINEKYDENYKLVYYGKQNDNLNGYAEFGGTLNQKEVFDVMIHSRLLIHTETFDESFRFRLQYSISTKIADSLASGTCLFAYGPKGLASIDYLDRNKCAFVCSDYDDLLSTLICALTDVNKRKKIQEQALIIAEKNHNSKNNSRKLHDILDAQI